MKTYTGTKTIHATPMSRLAYNKMRGWTVPADEDGTDQGFLVEYTDGGKANVAGFTGYVSWSPADVFERTYREKDYTAIEAEIQAKGKTAPRVTPADIEGCIVSEHFFTARDGRSGAIDNDTYAGREKPEGGNRDLQPLALLTFCVLVLRNGFTVTGESACASPENFDAEIGRKIARANAVEKIWMLEGYLLKQRLHDKRCVDARRD